ncbi:hypothetical protein SGPA1_90044 [Streptomyces misionensis JCM 4497]
MGHNSPHPGHLAEWGFAPRDSGTHGAHPSGRRAVCNAIERQGVFLRTGAPEVPCGVRQPVGPRPCVGVYGDLNTFRMALVPQSE